MVVGGALQWGHTGSTSIRFYRHKALINRVDTGCAHTWDSLSLSDVAWSRILKSPAKAYGHVCYRLAVKVSTCNNLARLLHSYRPVGFSTRLCASE
jgi:hypothetical protein